MSDIVASTDSFILNLFKDKLPATFLYHNYTHSKRVFKSIEEIIEASDLSDAEKTILRLSALLHDTGYTVTIDGHEEESVKIAKEFLSSHEVDDKIIKGVVSCIMATKFTGDPKNKLEEMIRDADASHFGKKYFNEASEFLRQEYMAQNLKEYSPIEWREENIKMLVEKHRFYSEYAMKNWQPRKEKNLAKLIKSRKKEKKKQKDEKLKAKYKAQYKNESPERGIQTFYRTALRNHIKLSDIADTKANILLSVNAIIISLVLSNLLSKLDTNPFLVVPSAVFVLSSTVTMILAVVATRPNVTRGEFTKEDVKNKNVNLTFFGNFHKMELSQFQWAIDELLKDRDYVYSSLTKDLYFLGKVLHRKYSILRWTYTIFVIGIITSIVAFAVSFAISEESVKQVSDIIEAAGN
jgi:predicted metal-dependent HD superfamily phosphohydrolase